MSGSQFLFILQQCFLESVFNCLSLFVYSGTIFVQILCWLFIDYSFVRKFLWTRSQSCVETSGNFLMIQKYVCVCVCVVCFKAFNSPQSMEKDMYVQGTRGFQNTMSLHPSVTDADYFLICLSCFNPYLAPLHLCVRLKLFV